MHIRIYPIFNINQKDIADIKQRIISGTINMVIRMISWVIIIIDSSSTKGGVSNILFNVGFGPSSE